MPKGPMEKGGRAGHTEAEEPHEGKRKRRNPPWLRPSHKQTTGREFTAKKRDQERERRK